MKENTLICFIILLVLASLPACQQRAVTEKEAAEKASQLSEKYTNPVFDQDFADPTPLKAPDGYFYVYGTNTEVDGEVVNIQVARSQDLISWEMLGDALPQEPSWAATDFWAPHVLYDAAKQVYYLYYSGESNDEALGKCLGVATAKSPAGPFVDKGKPLLCGEGFVNIDPMAFDDPLTGKKLLYWGSGFGAIKVQELAGDRMGFREGSTAIELLHPIADEDPENYQRLVEGAWVVYRKGSYYMFYSGDNCCGEQAHYAVMVARAENATGPFQTMAEEAAKGNSVLLERNARWIAPGHNSIITDAEGQDWMLYHAIDSAKRNEGRVLLMDKVSYKGGWPRIENKQPSTTEQRAPLF